MKHVILTVECPFYDRKTERCGQTSFADPCPLTRRYRCPKPVTVEFEDDSGEGIEVGEDRYSISKERP